LDAFIFICGWEMLSSFADGHIWSKT
jgi:hypothetical protein